MGNSRLKHSISYFAHLDELLVTLSPLISHTGQVGVSLLTVATNHTAVVELVLSEEALGVVIAVDVDLCEGIVSRWLFNSLVDTGLEQRQQKLQPTGKKKKKRLKSPQYSNVQCFRTVPVGTFSLED